MLRSLTLACMVIAARVAATDPSYAQTDPLSFIGPEFPPYYEYDAHGRMGGTLVDAFARLAAEADIAWAPAGLLPTRRALELLAQGAYDVSLLVKNPILDASGMIVSTTSPIGTLTLNLYSKDPLPESAGRDAMIGKTVLAMLGYGYGGMRSWLDDPANSVAVEDIRDDVTGIRMLLAGRADYALLYDANRENAREVLGDAVEDLHVVTLQSIPFYIHINESTVPNARELIDRFEEAARRLDMAESS